jgi:hypothetical protein
VERNLLRLGWADLVPQSERISRLAREAGLEFSRQRVSAIMNAVRVEPETIELIARAIGVKPSELTRDDPVEIP